MRMFKVYGALPTANGFKEGHIFICGKNKKDVIQQIDDYGLIGMTRIDLVRYYKNLNKVKSRKVW